MKGLGGSVLPTVQRASGDWFFPISTGAVTSAVAGGNNEIRVLPWLADSSFTLGQISTDVTIVGDVGSTIRPVIYADNGQGAPGALLLDAGALPGDAVAQPFANVAIPIIAGSLYWLGALTQNAPTTRPTVRCCSGPYLPVSVRAASAIPASGTIPQGYAVAGVSGAPPALFPLPPPPITYALRLTFKVA